MPLIAGGWLAPWIGPLEVAAPGAVRLDLSLTHKGQLPEWYRLGWSEDHQVHSVGTPVVGWRLVVSHDRKVPGLPVFLKRSVSPNGCDRSQWVGLP